MCVGNSSGVLQSKSIDVCTNALVFGHVINSFLDCIWFGLCLDLCLALGIRFIYFIFLGLVYILFGYYLSFLLVIYILFFQV